MENAQDKGSNPCSAIVCAIEKPTTKEGIRPAHLTVGKITQRAHSSSVGSSQCMRVCVWGGERERGERQTDKQTDRVCADVVFGRRLVPVYLLFCFDLISFAPDLCLVV